MLLYIIHYLYIRYIYIYTILYYNILYIDTFTCVLVNSPWKMVIYPNFRYWSVKPWFTAGQKFGSPKPSGFSHEQVLQCLLFGVFNWSQNISDISPTMCIPTQKNRTMYAQILSLSIHIPSYSRYIPSLHDGIWWYMMVYIYIVYHIYLQETIRLSHLSQFKAASIVAAAQQGVVAVASFHNRLLNLGW